MWIVKKQTYLNNAMFGKKKPNPQDVTANSMIKQLTSSTNGISLLFEPPHRRGYIYECAVSSPLVSCRITSTPHNRFSSYSEWEGLRLRGYFRIPNKLALVHHSQVQNIDLRSTTFYVFSIRFSSKDINIPIRATVFGDFAKVAFMLVNKAIRINMNRFKKKWSSLRR